MPLDVQSVTGYAVKDGEDVIQVFATEEEADAYAAAKNVVGAIAEAQTAIDTYNEDATTGILTINYSLTESGSLADLNTALQSIKTDYGISDPS